MQRTFRQLSFTLVLVWIVLAVAGFVYAGRLGLPARLAVPVIAAFLWEGSFYFAMGFSEVRESAARCWTTPAVAAGLTGSALAPYLVYTLPLGLFHWRAALLLLCLASAACAWFLLLPRNRFTDAGFIMLMAGVKLSGAFGLIYPDAAPRVDLTILGFLMWIRLGVMAALEFRGARGVGFGFWPGRKEWLIGCREYIYFLPLGLTLALATGLVRYRPMGASLWQWPFAAAGVFLGMLWVVALAEEFFFRGLLQRWLGDWSGSTSVGWVVAAVAFGLVHLPAGAFPNWRYALLAAIAGLFYGRAYQASGGIRAAMVAHALTNTTIQMLFPRA
jgi:membrane protease YdiL (CAAX protease family)